MKLRERQASVRDAAAFAAARRACYAGLGSVELRRDLARHVAPVLPSCASSFSLADPELGLLVDAVNHDVPAPCLANFVQVVYPEYEAERVLELVREDAVITTDPGEICGGPRFGLHHFVRLLLTSQGRLWGVWYVMRDAPFSPRELAFLRRLAPHVTRGLRSGALLDASRRPEGAGEEGAGHRPGVVVYDARLRPLLRDAAAREYLADLACTGAPDEMLPHPVVAALTRLRWRLASSSPLPDAPQDAALRVRGRSGRWYCVHAALAEPDAGGAAPTTVVITPAASADTAAILARLYGLTPRERTVVTRLLRGHSTKRIAAELKISAHTVQDYIERSCDKVGVRGRKALLAKLFFDTGAARDLDST